MWDEMRTVVVIEDVLEIIQELFQVDKQIQRVLQISQLPNFIIN